ncbi:DUF2934 domain-containing protein [Ancylobacter dichloromethanicus]
MSTEQESPVDSPLKLKIEHRAYEIWVGEGSPNGCDLEHWLRAEAEVTSAEPESKLALKKRRSCEESLIVFIGCFGRPWQSELKK